MTQTEAPAPPAASNIYDLGYRTYAGERLGRRHAFVSLFTYSLRACFGLGRSTLNKVFPIGLAVLALLPAGGQLTLAAVSPVDLEVWTPENYFSYVELVLALFCAVVAPEIIGRDQRNRTLPLYFSRALRREDYVSAKVAALVAAILIVVLVPHAVLFLGAAVATEDLLGYVLDHVDRIPPIIASSAVVAAFMASLSLAIASFTPNRALATGVVLGYGVIMTTLAHALVEATTGTVHDYVILLSTYDILEGTVAWIFGSAPLPQAFLAKVSLPLWVYFAFALAYIAVCLTVIYRRFRRLVV